MNKIVIVNKGHAAVGKSLSIYKVYEKLQTLYPSAVTDIKKDGDITATIDINGVLVGIESQGDPNSRMFATLPDLVARGCQIIVCACRTSGATKQRVADLRKDGFDIIWTTNPRNPNLADELNTMWADLVTEIIVRKANDMI